MSKKKILLAAIAILLIISCKNTSNPNGADAIYYGGDIITMEGDSANYVEAIALKAGKIVFTGTMAEAEKMKGDSTQMNDLKGKTLVPGFIDGHAHFAGFGAQAVAANLLASPDGTVNSIPELIQELKKWHQENGTSKTNGWIIGTGFDDAILKEKRFPTKEDLDQVSKEIPICIIHISGHFCVLNSKALEMNKISAATKNPAGGLIRRVAGSQEPNGVLEEMAGIPIFFSLINPSDPAIAEYYMEKAQEMALKFGYTTAQEGRAMTNHENMAAFAEKGKFKIDVVAYIDFLSSKYMHTNWNSKTYNQHYRIGGLKLTLDGSPQGRTAWRTKPYLIAPDGAKPSYMGYPTIPDDNKVKAVFDSAFANNWQILTHTNGDAAIDQLIRCIKPAVAKYGNNDRRNVMIHGQYIRFDQLDSLKKLDMVASLFPMHTFYWGDWHKQIIGDSLGNLISPIKTALKKGLHVTSHTDAPVAFPNLAMILWTTVNRVSRSGAVIGAEERLSAYEALKSITIWGA
jgi:predicted amidohydrolase YtcJ